MDSRTLSPKIKFNLGILDNCKFFKDIFDLFNIMFQGLLVKVSVCYVGHYYFNTISKSLFKFLPVNAGFTRRGSKSAHLLSFMWNPHMAPPLSMVSQALTICCFHWLRYHFRKTLGSVVSLFHCCFAWFSEEGQIARTTGINRSPFWIPHALRMIWPSQLICDDLP